MFTYFSLYLALTFLTFLVSSPKWLSKWRLYASLIWCFRLLNGTHLVYLPTALFYLVFTFPKLPTFFLYLFHVSLFIYFYLLLFIFFIVLFYVFIFFTLRILPILLPDTQSSYVHLTVTLLTWHTHLGATPNNLFLTCASYTSISFWVPAFRLQEYQCHPWLTLPCNQRLRPCDCRSFYTRDLFRKSPAHPEWGSISCSIWNQCKYFGKEKCFVICKTLFAEL